MRATIACCIAATLALVIVAVMLAPKGSAFHFGADGPSALPGTPSALTVIDNGRNFGYRIADPVAVSIYIRQPKGVTVDAETLVVEGDFEVTAQPVTTVQTLPDGGKGLRLQLTAQSFSPAPRLSMRFTLSYRVPGNREEQELRVPPIVVHTSRTWDGRQNLKGEVWSSIPVAHWGATLLLLCTGLVTGVLFGRKLAQIRREVIELDLGPDRRTLAIAQFCKCLLALKRGENPDEHNRLLCGLIRSWYKMPALPLELVPVQTYEQANGPVTTALTKVELALFSREPLDAPGIDSLLACGAKMFFPTLGVDEARKSMEQACASFEKEVKQP
jgi:hypothetical protein